MATSDRSVTLAPDLTLCRTLTGMWQVSGAHGAIDPAAAVQAMLSYHDAGLTTWDLADHYGPAEDLIGAFRRALAAQRGSAELARVQALTKWVPQAGPVRRAQVEAAIDRSRRRMGVDTLDLLQFHWWEYADPGYLTALDHLAELRERGWIAHLALTNFDTQRLREILDRGIPIVSNQVQYSLVDLRPSRQMAQLCAERGVGLLAYGTLCGGLLSERYVGAPEPSRADLTTASQRKYKQMIDLWGGWALFQELLATLKAIAERRGASIAPVALRAILDQPVVAGVIVGARLGVSAHIPETLGVAELSLTDEDRASIVAVQARGADLLHRIGDCGDEYRR
ncbi:aldo/keto reductase [Candidatus Chloroploca sp. Khr17]|uniref:aldo/keto reductase n=1 Tax=Candidatus Chloroploca sp. Khr17 TaxID=2496869 RepID=UPI00101C1DDB|nr:aldo/keto reductase [Candidatus Chloroploca sp. Khr17]